MAESCKKVREKLIDIYYGEGQWTDEIQGHLKDCPQCAQYRESLNGLREKLLMPELEGEADERVLRSAFREADRRQIEKKNLLEFGMFLGTAVFILACVGWVVRLGYGMQVVISQVALVTLITLSLPFFIKRRLAKEGY